MPVTSIRSADARPLEPEDIVTLAVLGTADTEAASIADVQGVIRQVALGDWQPTADVLQAAIARATSASLLVESAPAKGDGSTLFATTEQGRRMIRQ